MIEWVAPVALACVLAAAGGLKLADPVATGDAYADLGLPAPRVAAVALPVLELLVAALLVAAPVAGALAALVLLLGFSAFLAWHLLRGTEAPCNCFGQARARPISGRDLVRNAVLGAVALVVLAFPPG